jgi:hypothetical protein
MKQIRTCHKLKTNWLIVWGLLVLLTVCIGCKRKSSFLPTFSQIELGFKNIPDSVQTSVYWYWVSDNISKEGVVKDLQAMKKVGINRAFISNIGLNEGYSRIPYGKVKIFSDEWWDILHTALKTATELNIEIGIFNSPGWSQSGGPWVKPEQSMRYLNSSEIVITGPQQFKQKLIAPNSDFQRVNVIAYKAPADFGLTLRAFNPKITCEPKVADIKNIMDGDLTTQIQLPVNQRLTIDFETAEIATVRSLNIRTAEKPIKAEGVLLVKQDNEYRKVKDFVIDRSKPDLSVGFDPYAPIVISIPETKSKIFRMVISETNPPGAIAEIDLSAAPRVERYPEKSLAKMFQTPLPYWHDYMWPDQPEVEDKSLVIDPQKVLDITNYMTADGTLNWSVPEGNWVIMQNGMTTTRMVNGAASPEGTGLEVDKMSKKHIAYNFDAFLGEIMRRVPAEDRKTWKVVVADSYECGSQNWTDGFIEDFISKYGYDPVPYIPTLKGYIVGSRTVSDRFLWDLRRIVADKIAYDYVGGLRQVSHKNGLTTWLENYGHWGFSGEFLQYGGQSDEVAGEFWSEGDLGNIENRAASSCAHIYGKIKVSAESFTSGGVAFSRYPAKMKQRADRFFTEGINNTLLHVYIQQPNEIVPGVNAWFGNEFNRHNTWFSQLDLFIQYLKRTNFMLQQGTYVADVAYFIGEDVPKMTGVCDPPLPKGYSFDYINSEVLHQRATVKDGKIVLPDGMSYRILVLPKLETMRPEMLARIKELVTQGAVVLGPAPKRSPSLKNYPVADQQVQKLATELWGKVDGEQIKSARVGKGMILSGMEMNEALDLIKVIPDCKLAKEDPSLFIHRTGANGDIYFISNQSDSQITIKPEMRISGFSPELWDPITGAIRDLPAYSQNANTTIVPLKLEAFGSQFIIFRKKAGKAVTKDLAANFPDEECLIKLNGPWSVTFDIAKRGPVKPVVFATLQDWTTSNNDSIKYYSGTAFYKTTFTLDQMDSKSKLFVDLGIVKAMAKVKLNGIDVGGGVWTAPWKVDISAVAKAGENILEVEVVNTWVNRLIGDSKLPVAERKTWCSVNPFKPESPLDPSGLLGPVKIVSETKMF